MEWLTCMYLIVKQLYRNITSRHGKESLGSQFDALSGGSVAIFYASLQFGKSFFRVRTVRQRFSNRSRYQNILKINCHLTSWTSPEPLELAQDTTRMTAAEKTERVMGALMDHLRGKYPSMSRQAKTPPFFAFGPNADRFQTFKAEFKQYDFLQYQLNHKP